MISISRSMLLAAALAAFPLAGVIAQATPENPQVPVPPPWAINRQTLRTGHCHEEHRTGL